MNPFTGSRTPLILSPHGVQDSLVFWIPCRGFRIPGTAVRIPIRPYMYSGIQNPGIPDSTAKFPGFRNQSTSENFPESGILIPLHGANTSLGCQPSDSTSGEPDSKQVAVISKEISRFRFRFQNKRTYSFDSLWAHYNLLLFKNFFHSASQSSCCSDGTLSRTPDSSNSTQRSSLQKGSVQCTVAAGNIASLLSTSGYTTAYHPIKRDVFSGLHC